MRTNIVGYKQHRSIDLIHQSATYFIESVPTLSDDSSYSLANQLQFYHVSQCDKPCLLSDNVGYIR